jgi:hypothetical protein
MPVHRGGKKGTKKYGRNKEKCKRYAERGTLRKRKVKRLMRDHSLTRAEAERVWDTAAPTPKRRKETA